MDWRASCEGNDALSQQQQQQQQQQQHHIQHYNIDHPPPSLHHHQHQHQLHHQQQLLSHHSIQDVEQDQAINEGYAAQHSAYLAGEMNAKFTILLLS